MWCVLFFCNVAYHPRIGIHWFFANCLVSPLVTFLLDKGVSSLLCLLWLKILDGNNFVIMSPSNESCVMEPHKRNLSPVTCREARYLRSRLNMSEIRSVANFLSLRSKVGKRKSGHRRLSSIQMRTHDWIWRIFRILGNPEKSSKKSWKSSQKRGVKKERFLAPFLGLDANSPLKSMKKTCFFCTFFNFGLKTPLKKCKIHPVHVSTIKPPPPTGIFGQKNTDFLLF